MSEAFAATYAAAFPSTRPWSAEEFAAFEADKFITIIGTPDSFLILRVIVDEAEIITIATHPSHRRKGLAGKTLQVAINECANKNATRLFLEVAADNSPAIALYDSQGFAPIGLRKGYYPRKDIAAVDAVTYEKRISLK
ncbi:MAG: GNAT family N-acetyltransferase [Planktomarina sp.]